MDKRGNATSAADEVDHMGVTRECDSQVSSSHPRKHTHTRACMHIHMHARALAHSLSFTNLPPSPSPLSFSANRHTALHRAARNGDVHSVNFLLEENKHITARAKCVTQHTATQYNTHQLWHLGSVQSTSAFPLPPFSPHHHANAAMAPPLPTMLLPPATCSASRRSCVRTRQWQCQSCTPTSCA